MYNLCKKFRKVLRLRDYKERPGKFCGKNISFVDYFRNFYKEAVEKFEIDLGETIRNFRKKF